MNSLLLTFYGDDFTGSTDALEALSRAGVRTLLWAEAPSPEHLSRFPDVQAVGVAGVSRSLAPDAMRRELEPRFEVLRSLGAPICHYKTCSTFDSSPKVGSIGCALDLGQEIFQSPFVPILVGVPILGRYVAFGNLFARAGAGGGSIYRLDRHPTMSRHPITPMDESDLRLHLSHQTNKSIALFDVLQLSDKVNVVSAFAALLQQQPDAVLFDTLEPKHLETIGALLWGESQKSGPLFAVGSSGVEYALTAHWKSQNLLPALPVFEAAALEQIIVVSGSCSPITAAQITHAETEGFLSIALDVLALLDDATKDAEIRRCVHEVRKVLKSGSSPLLHTCRGPHDKRLEPVRAALKNKEASSSQILGKALGTVLKVVWQETDLRRAIVTGGDTSSYAARELGFEALELAAPAFPGAPICRILAKDCALDGREIVFKGGQVGPENFFSQMREMSLKTAV